MAEFRTLHVKIWKDEWFCRLKPDSKLLFIYLVTNEAATLAGIYKLPEKFIMFESGIGAKRVSQIMTEFAQADKVHYQDGVVWVVNLRRYQTFDGRANDNVKKRIQKDIDDIPSGELKRRYLAYYAAETTHPIPMPNPSNTNGIPAADININNDNDINKDINTSSGAGAPCPELSPGQNLFLERWKAKRLNDEQKDAILKMESAYGLERLTECIVWAREKNLPLGQAIGSIRTAIKHWGESKSSANGKKSAPLTPEQVSEMNRKLNPNWKGFKAAE